MPDSIVKITKVGVNKIDKLKLILNEDRIQEQFKGALKENAGSFLASVIELYAADNYLQECNPSSVVMEALKAATLKLPVNKQLGFSYIVPYKQKGVLTPQMQIGYKGYIQLAMRTGQYKYINADRIPEGMEIERDILTGEIIFKGDTKPNPTAKAQGYFAYIELLNGFRKTVYMTRDEVMAHAKKYSKSFSQDYTPWKTNFDEMALKTCIKAVLGHYGILSVEMLSALNSDVEDIEDTVSKEVAFKANSETIDITDFQVKDEAAAKQDDSLVEPDF